VALPAPQPGLVINYAYLWSDEAGRGLREGRKDRPCVVVLSVEDRQGGKWVTVAPVTHSPPAEPEWSIEIPSATKQRLGLDDAPSWVITTETNWFLWPSPDLRPIGRKRPARFAYGFLPARLVVAIREKLAKRRELRMVRRDR
jgi:hypothetical protein